MYSNDSDFAHCIYAEQFIIEMEFQLLYNTSFLTLKRRG